MRQLTLVQELDCSVDEHWRLYFDDAFDREQYLVGLGYAQHELLERTDSETELVRRTRFAPRLDVPLMVRLLGTGFSYIEDGRFDKTTAVYRARLQPSIFAERLDSSLVVRAEAVGAWRCRRFVDLTISVRVFGFGKRIEAGLEQNLRIGWTDSARYLNERLAAERRQTIR